MTSSRSNCSTEPIDAVIAPISCSIDSVLTAFKACMISFVVDMKSSVDTPLITLSFNASIFSVIEEASNSGTLIALMLSSIDWSCDITPERSTSGTVTEAGAGTLRLIALIDSLTWWICAIILDKSVCPDGFINETLSLSFWTLSAIFLICSL